MSFRTGNQASESDSARREIANDWKTLQDYVRHGICMDTCKVVLRRIASLKEKIGAAYPLGHTIRKELLNKLNAVERQARKYEILRIVC
jgi:hypothetical protein